MRVHMKLVPAFELLLVTYQLVMVDMMSETLLLLFQVILGHENSEPRVTQYCVCDLSKYSSLFWRAQCRGTLDY